MTNIATDVATPAITEPFAVVDDFLPLDLALSMRADIDRHFSDPVHHRPETHMIWNYWYVPETYTYLRAQPDRVIEREKVDTFVSTLRNWASERLGLGIVTWPILSLYVDGCNQQLHNDSMNGRFAFVYSLTNPVRRTIGGGTILMSPGDPFRRHLAKPMTQKGFCQVVEPRFNRLLIFDDRIVHGVERVEGSMDPVEGRFVLHGHIQDNGPLTAGPLPREALLDGLQASLGLFVSQLGEDAFRFHGPISLRFEVSPAGAVEGLHVLVDRVTHVDERDDGAWPSVRRAFLEAVGRARFAPAEGPTTVILPMAFSGPAGRPSQGN